MKNVFKNVSKIFLVVIGIVLFAMLLPAFITGMALCVAGPGVAIVDDAVTVLKTDELVPNLNLKDIDKVVAMLNPSRYPLDTILRNSNKTEKINSFIKKYYAVASPNMYDAIDDTAVGDGSTSSVPAKAYTYASGDGVSTYWIKVTDVTLWQADDILVMRDLGLSTTGALATTGLTDIQDVNFYVHKVENSSIKVSPLNGTLGLNTKAAVYCMPDFTSAAVLYKLGQAKNEMAAKTTAFQVIPEPDENYCQYFMRMVQQSNFDKDQAKEVNWTIADYEKMATLQIRAEIEASSIWGAKSIITNTETLDKRYTMDGLSKMITNVVEFGSGGTNKTITTTQLINLFETLFVGNSGSTRKTIFAGAGVVNSLMQFQLDNKTYMKTTAREEWGVQFSDWLTDYGVFSVIHAPLFTSMGWRDVAMCLDMEFIQKSSRQTLERKEKDFEATGESNSIGIVIKECSTVYLQNPDSHCIFRKKA